MAETTLHVEIVAADRLVWSGEATMVSARTAEGDIGVLVDHAPVLSVMHGGAVEITEPSGTKFRAAVSDGFISVAANRVSVLAERVQLAEEIDASQARAELDEVTAAAESSDDPEVVARLRFAQGRVDALTK
ncbi:MAG: F0F1 ATP synthase subunit epsilon [Nocardioides sp.]